ncbi:PX domain-containing protein [Colletotrichum orchidophilum]|uniref:PX domain-containing protein n=1 Tax=Colletotrichum orchidophilum TaxID=1209926 RepID=A0A1G4AZK0_9PEZI|nr:PX domain-containing protein [Colletotrichum orchidophilum]OHE94608.1 PX domain-containing protein [Colletotrichum orchidophilum]
MWNDEDNNPYGEGFDRRDSLTSSSANPASPTTREYLDDSSDSTDAEWESLDQRFDIPQTPSTTSDEAPQNRSHTLEDSDVESSDNEPIARDRGDLVPRPKPGGYESRVEQILWENPAMTILITDAGKSAESGGKYIVYTIRTGNLEVRRRYSEFSSLREALTRLHPTLIIPPIPEKHTMADYAANPTSAKQDQQIIDLRKRMLAVFLNRCRRMEEVRTDGVWWRFLDPNASWSEVLHSHPVASVPKSILKAPPLDPANPTPAHNFLPVPSTSAKLKTTGGPGVDPGAISGTGSHVFGRFPPDSHTLSEQELDPYFITYEASIKEMEQLLSGSMEKVNRRTLSHLSALAADLCELGSKFNAFALSEQAPSLGPALERVGQAADSSYIATEELSGSLGASFAEPMRENAQFAGVVRSVLKYRVLKRVQQEQTSDELSKKITLLDQLERSEQEAKRIEQYLSSSQQIVPAPKRSTSLREANSSHHQREGSAEDTASIDSDFPPTHGEPVPTATQGVPQRSNSTPGHKKAASSNSITNKIFGPIRHAIQGVADVDPERTRRDMIGKTRESIEQLEQAKVVSEHDVKEASASILKDLKRFQGDKEEDLRRYMLAYAKSQIEWAKKNKETWEDAKAEVAKIDES